MPDAATKRGMCVSLSLFNSSVDNGAGGHTQSYIGAGFEGGQLVILDLRSGGKIACEITVTQDANACMYLYSSKLARASVLCNAGYVICGPSAVF